MRVFLVSACLLLSGLSVSGLANASLPTASETKLATALPASRLGPCLEATELWNANMDMIRFTVVSALATGADNAIAYSAQASQAESPYDLPDLLESAKMIDYARQLRVFLAQMDAARDTSCKAS